MSPFIIEQRVIVDIICGEWFVLCIAKREDKD